MAGVTAIDRTGKPHIVRGAGGSRVSVTPTTGSSGMVAHALPTSTDHDDRYVVGATTTPVLATNLILNPSIEVAADTGLVNGGTGASIVRSTAQAKYGAASALFTYGDNATNDSGPALHNGTIGPLLANTEYTASAWVYIPVAFAGGVGLNLFAYGTTVGSTVRGVTSTTVGAWTRLTLTFTTVAAGNFTGGIGKSASVALTGAQFYYDGLMVTQGREPLDYFDGSLPGARWTGTPHASTSELLLPRTSDLTAFPTAGLHTYRGNWSPEGVLAAPVGSTYVDVQGANGAVQYTKMTGTGKTGWKVTTGDTGWRNMSSLLINGWTMANGIRMRRIDDSVHLMIGGANGTAATVDQLLALPVGFRCGTYGIVSPRYPMATTTNTLDANRLWVTDIVGHTVRALGSAYTGITSGHGLLQFLTADAWPATLPGTAA